MLILLKWTEDDNAKKDDSGLNNAKQVPNQSKVVPNGAKQPVQCKIVLHLFLIISPLFHFGLFQNVGPFPKMEGEI